MNAFRDAPMTTGRDARQLVAAREQLEVVLERLAEADAGVDEDLSPRSTPAAMASSRHAVSSRATSLTTSS